MDSTKVVLRSGLNLGFNLNFLEFYCKFCAFKIIIFYIAIFEFFYPKINKSNIHNNITDISSFQNGLNDLFTSTGFYLKSKVIEGSH